MGARTEEEPQEQNERCDPRYPPPARTTSAHRDATHTAKTGGRGPHLSKPPTGPSCPSATGLPFVAPTSATCASRTCAIPLAAACLDAHAAGVDGAPRFQDDPGLRRLRTDRAEREFVEREFAREPVGQAVAELPVFRRAGVYEQSRHGSIPTVTLGRYRETAVCGGGIGAQPGG